VRIPSRSAALAVVLVAAAGCAGAAPTVTPPRAVPSSPSVRSPAAVGQGQLGMRLTPGSYVSSVFDTPISFSIPEGWKVFEDEIGQFGLARLANDGPCLCVWRDVVASSSDESCREVPEPDVGTTARDIAEWLHGHPGIVSDAPTTVAVGGLSGYLIDISIDPGWTATCPFSGSESAVPTLLGSGISSGVAWDVRPSSQQRLYLLDLPDGAGNIALNLEVCCGVDLDDQIAADDAVIDTFHFHT